MKSPETIEDTLLAVNVALRQLAAWGCSGFECSDQTLAALKRWGGPQPPALDEGETLEQIRADLGDCHRCGLAQTRRKIVFGEGDPNARLIFVGEGPGSEEDRRGRPFVGPAGELLTRIIEAMKLSREQVYIGNVIKCRPPGNRNPTAEEITTCGPFLERQLAVMAPKVICTLGSFAAQTLLQTQTPVTQLRGRFHTYKGIKLMPTYHPAYLLLNPDQKRAVWEDMKKIMALLGIQP